MQPSQAPGKRVFEYREWLISACLIGLLLPQRFHVYLTTTSITAEELTITSSATTTKLTITTEASTSTAISTELHSELLCFDIKHPG